MTKKLQTDMNMVGQKLVKEGKDPSEKREAHAAFLDFAAKKNEEKREQQIKWLRSFTHLEGGCKAIHGKRTKDMNKATCNKCKKLMEDK